MKDKSEQTKFELGSQLGFIGELGFTSIPQEIFLYDYCNAQTAEKSEIRSNFEGDSDKYTRGIASWLIQMNWVTSHRKNITATYEGKNYSANLQVYFITRTGGKALSWKTLKKIQATLKKENLDLSAVNFKQCITNISFLLT